MYQLPNQPNTWYSRYCKEEADGINALWSYTETMMLVMQWVDYIVWGKYYARGGRA